MSAAGYRQLTGPRGLERLLADPELDEVVPPVLPDREALIAAGLELAHAIAAKSPLAVAGAKMSLNYSRGRTVEEGLRHVALWNAGALVSADLTAAVRGRLSKTVPEYKDLDA